MDSFSVADTRSNITKILHTVEEGSPVQITRRGRPVAILLSMNEYQRLSVKRHDFAEALERFEASTHPDDRFEVSFLEDLRDRNSGREVSL